MELANVLNTWSYKDRSDNYERRRMILARQRSRRLREWIFEHHELLTEDGEVIDPNRDFFWPWLVQQGHTLLAYKQEAIDAGIYHRELGEDGCTVEDVARILQFTFMDPPELYEMYKTRSDPCSTFAWQGPILQVRKKIGRETEFPGKWTAIVLRTYPTYDIYSPQIIIAIHIEKDS
jgi:hypothetical protein